jgi:hypothetical protein
MACDLTTGRAVPCKDVSEEFTQYTSLTSVTWER